MQKLEQLQTYVNNDHQLSRDQKLNRLLWAVLSDDIDNWLASYQRITQTEE